MRPTSPSRCRYRPTTAKHLNQGGHRRPSSGSCLVGPDEPAKKFPRPRPERVKKRQHGECRDTLCFGRPFKYPCVAAPRPVFRALDEAGADRIERDVPQRRQEMRVVVDPDPTVTLGEEVPCSSMPSVVSACMLPEQVAHSVSHINVLRCVGMII